MTCFSRKKSRRSGAFASIYESIQCHTEQHTKVLLRNFKHNDDCKSAGRKKRKKCKNEGRRKVCQSKLFYYDCFIFQTKNEMKMNQDEKENLIKWKKNSLLHNNKNGKLRSPTENVITQFRILFIDKSESNRRILFSFRNRRISFISEICWSDENVSFNFFCHKAEAFPQEYEGEYIEQVPTGNPLLMSFPSK